MTTQSKPLFNQKIAEAGFKDYTDFAKALGVKSNAVSRWSKGSRPDNDTLLKIRKITNGKMNADWFLDFYEICQKEKEQSKKV